MPLEGSIQLRSVTSSAAATSTEVPLANQPVIVVFPDGKFRLYRGDGVTQLQTLYSGQKYLPTNEHILALLATYIEGPLMTDPTFGGATNSDAPSSLAVKQLVDDRVAAVDWKDAVRVRTTANITLSGTQTIDGVALSAGDRVLVMNQSTATQNGIYVVAAGAWSRSDDANTGLELAWATVTVMEGTVHAGTRWTCNTSPITLGSTNVSWTSFGGGTYTADEATLELVGSQFRAKDDGITAAKLAHAVLKAIAGVITTPVAGHVPRMTGASTAELMPVTDQSKDLLALSSVALWLQNLGVPFNQVLTKNADFTVALNERGCVFRVTTGSATITATLPSASTAGNGFVVVIQKADTGSGTVVTSPATAPLLHEDDRIILESDGASWIVISPTSPAISIPLISTINAIWSAMPSALNFFQTVTSPVRLDLRGRKLIRLSAMVGVAGAAGSKLILKYRTSYSGVVTDYQDFASEVSVSLAAVGPVTSNWIALPAAAQADVFVVLSGSGGNGSTSPNVRSVIAEFH
ncbi:MAG: hypothetical protein JNL05_12935 [Flavobacteriales bacterium]|nr:hypothetical protein [Flavobacteriales bacterium]